MKITRTMKLNAMVIMGDLNARKNLDKEITCITFHHRNEEKVEKFAEKFFVEYVITGCKDLGYTAYCYLEK